MANAKKACTQNHSAGSLGFDMMAYIQTDPPCGALDRVGVCYLYDLLLLLFVYSEPSWFLMYENESKLVHIRKTQLT